MRSDYLERRLNPLREKRKVPIREEVIEDLSETINSLKIKGRIFWRWDAVEEEGIGMEKWFLKRKPSPWTKKKLNTKVNKIK